MTTVAFKDGLIAADSQGTCGETRVTRIVKILETHDCGWAAIVGKLSEARRVLRWLDGDRSADQPVTSNCSIVLFNDYERLIYEDGGYEPLGDAPFYAWGSGAAVALGAMAAGASAEEAVKIACRFDVWSAEPVQVVEAP